ncbi:hypothetical protein GF385_02880 [Candidatus Dependentiae bacterium]|nr:hypothetical protein [Candidatus Dependentiae bacterium]
MPYSFYKVNKDEKKEDPLEKIPQKSKLASQSKITPKKPEAKKPKKKGESKGIKITSDKIRTGYYLITHTSARGRIEEIWDDLKEFFTTNQIEKIGGEYKIIEKEKNPI